VAPGGLQYFLPDAPSTGLRAGLGSARQLTGAAGALALAQSFDPYGGLLSSQGSAATPYGFTGEWGDAGGLLYLRARDYLPQVGIFTARDTWAGDFTAPASLNDYLYAQDNPLRYVDPTGHAISPPACPFGCTIWDYSRVGGSSFSGRLLRAFISTGTELVDFILTRGATQTDPRACTWNLAGYEDRFITGVTPPNLLGVIGGRQLPLPGFDRFLDLDDATYQIHHLITNKGDYWPDVMRKITNKYMLDIDGSWNKVPLPGHSGSHTDWYHNWVNKKLLEIDAIAKGDQEVFLELFNKKVKTPILDNPRLPYRDR
jgi:RHS repeat-associated protein